MKIETKEIYKCEYCRKLYQIKNRCGYHEMLCTKNPKNKRACYGCQYLTKETALIKVGCDNYYTQEPEKIKRNFLYCQKKKIFLYTPQNEVKGNHKHLDEYGNDFEHYPMPMKCEDRK